MPEPNLPPLRLQLEGPESENRNVLNVERIRKSLPEMPDETRERLVRDFSIPIDFAVRFVNDPPLLDFFLEAVKFKPKNITVTNNKRREIFFCEIIYCRKYFNVENSYTAFYLYRVP